MKTRCPSCGRPVNPHRKVPWRPFCSERCRLIDLGAWLDDSRRIPLAEETGIPEEMSPANEVSGGSAFRV